MFDLHDMVVAAGIPIDHHESDLYFKVTPNATRIVAAYVKAGGADIIRPFTSERDGTRWYEAPFQFSPFWRRRA